LEDRRAVGDAPTQSSLRWQWPEQGDFLRDLVIWTLRARLPRTAELPLAEGVIRQVHAGLSPLEALKDVAWEHVIRLLRQAAFRLQVLIEATPIAFDGRVDQALQYLASTNADAWTPFWGEIIRTFGHQLRGEHAPERIATSWHVGTQSVARAALSGAGLAPDVATLGEPAASLLEIILEGMFPQAAGWS
jgi:hypothetical protein